MEGVTQVHAPLSYLGGFETCPNSRGTQGTESTSSPHKPLATVVAWSTYLFCISWILSHANVLFIPKVNKICILKPQSSLTLPLCSVNTSWSAATKSPQAS